MLCFPDGTHFTAIVGEGASVKERRFMFVTDDAFKTFIGWLDVKSGKTFVAY